MNSQIETQAILGTYFFIIKQYYISIKLICEKTMKTDAENTLLIRYRYRDYAILN